MTPPVFETPRLILKSITEHDAEGLHEAYGDAGPCGTGPSLLPRQHPGSRFFGRCSTYGTTISISFEGWLRSDDRGIAKLGHHARHHVVEIVAVKRPAAGIVGVKGDGDAAHWRHQDGIAHGTRARRAV